jgi:outer membrane lipoprotein-sorting protein
MRVSRGFSRRFATVVAVILLGAWWGFVVSASAQQAEGDQEEGSGAPVFPDEPAAHALYKQMIDAMWKADSLSYVSHYSFEARGMTIGDCTYRAWLKKPNQFRVETESARRGEGGTLVGDGQYLWIFWPQGRPRQFELDEADEATRHTSYMKKFTPRGMHSIGHEVVYLGAGMSMPILDPSTFHGYTDSLQAYVEGVRSLGTEKVGDEECDKIEVSIMKGQRSWYLWLAKRDHLPRKLKQIVRVSYDITMHEDWSSVTLNADIPDEKFAWKPPDGWTEWRLPDPEDRLLKPGTEAPDFEFASIDGQPIRLSDYRGRIVWFYIWRAG